MEGSHGIASQTWQPGDDFQKQLFALEFAGHWAIRLTKVFQMQLDISL